MKKNPTNFDFSLKNGYIPAPCVPEEGGKINDFYLGPVLFRNESGLIIGGSYCRSGTGSSSLGAWAPGHAGIIAHCAASLSVLTDYSPSGWRLCAGSYRYWSGT